MTRLKVIISEFAADGADHTDRMFSLRRGHFDDTEAARNTFIQSRELLAEADAMLAKIDKALIQEYYRAAKQGH
jgi:hypothetical protein